MTASIVVEEEQSVVRAVELGVAWLDEHSPGWSLRVDVQTAFDIRVGYRCVLGQVFGDFCEAMYEHGLSSDDGDRLGFNIWGANREDARWDGLQVEWSRVILERQASF